MKIKIEFTFTITAPRKIYSILLCLIFLQISQVTHIEATSNNCAFHVIYWVKIIIKIQEICEVMNTSLSAVVRKYNFYDMRAKNVSIGRFNARFYQVTFYVHLSVILYLKLELQNLLSHNNECKRSFKCTRILSVWFQFTFIANCNEWSLP